MIELRLGDRIDVLLGGKDHQPPKLVSLVVTAVSNSAPLGRGEGLAVKLGGRCGGQRWGEEE